MASPTEKPAGLVRRTERGTRIVAALVGAVLAVLVGYLALQRLGKSLVSASYDMPFLVHQAGGAKDIRIVYLDQLDGESLDRRPQARILDKLAETGARAVVYDLIFDQPSQDPQIDKDFADSMRRFRGVDAEGNPIPGAPASLCLSRLWAGGLQHERGCGRTTDPSHRCVARCGR
jgi:CHASE2 domain-containing sensor protein